MSFGGSLRHAVEFSGTGLHSGKSVRVRIVPNGGKGLRIGSGERFFPLEQGIPSGDGRGSRVVFPGEPPFQVCTVEHLFAAVAGLGIGDIDMDVDGGEIPVLDGSALPFAEMLYEAREMSPAGFGSSERACLRLFAPIVVTESKGDRLIAASPAATARITYVLDYAHPLVGTSTFSFTLGDAESFLAEVAGARTFALLSEVEGLRSRGLAKGGSLENAVVVGDEGLLNPEGLRFPDEYVRHKVVDLLGDLLLLGMPLHAHVVALRAGHALHLEFVRRLRRLAATAHVGG